MPYRDDIAALEEQRAQIEAELAEVRERRGELVALEQVERDLERSLEDVCRLQEKRRRRLPRAPEYRVASPCHTDWDAMVGDDRSRRCASCAMQVYNLSELTVEQGQRLIEEREGKLCVRFYKRADGTVITADCPTGRRLVRLRRVVAVAVGASLAAAGLVAVHRSPTARAWLGKELPTLDRQQVVMGGFSRDFVKRPNKASDEDDSWLRFGF